MTFHCICGHHSRDQIEDLDVVWQCVWCGSDDRRRRADCDQFLRHGTKLGVVPIQQGIVALVEPQFGEVALDQAGRHREIRQGQADRVDSGNTIAYKADAEEPDFASRHCGRVPG